MFPVQQQTTVSFLKSQGFFRNRDLPTQTQSNMWDISTNKCFSSKHFGENFVYPKSRGIFETISQKEISQSLYDFLFFFRFYPVHDVLLEKYNSPILHFVMPILSHCQREFFASVITNVDSNLFLKPEISLQTSSLQPTVLLLRINV